MATDEKVDIERKRRPTETRDGEEEVAIEEGYRRERTSDIDKRPTKGRRRPEQEELCGNEQVPKAKTSWKV